MAPATFTVTVGRSECRRIDLPRYAEIGEGWPRAEFYFGKAAEFHFGKA